MRGHEKILEMRRAGKTPRHVFVNDYSCQTDWFETGEHATICVAGDDIALLDLRFLVGLNVSISSESESRSKALFEAAKRSGAVRVGACAIEPEKSAWAQSGWSEVWRKEAA